MRINQNVTQRREANKCVWKKKSTYRYVQCRVSTNLRFVQNAISAKCNKAKHNKMKYARIKYFLLASISIFLELFLESFCPVEASVYQSKNAFHCLRGLEFSLLRVPLKADLSK